MKKLSKLIITMAVSITFILCTALCASAEDEFDINPLNLHMTDCTSTTMSFSWNGVGSSSGNTVDGWVVLVYDSSKVTDIDDIDDFDGDGYDQSYVLPASKRSAKLSNSSTYLFEKNISLKSGKSYLVSLSPVFTDGTIGEKYMSFADGNTTPAKMSKSDISVSPVRSTTSYYYVKYSAAKPKYATKVQLKTYSMGGSVLSTKTFTSTSTELKLTKNKAYKYRVRACYVNETTGKTYYGSWSSYRYMDFPKSTCTTKSTVKGCKIKLTGVSYVSKYKIYVSTSSSSIGTLTKTVTPSKGKTVSYTVNKKGSSYMKKGTRYYITVVPYIKSGSTLYKSDIKGVCNFVSPK